MNNILDDAFKHVQNAMKHSGECPEYLAQFMDEELDKIKNLTLGIDTDSKGEAIFYTRNNEDFQLILKAMSFFGNEYNTIKCWNTIDKEVVTMGGPVEVIEWHTKFPFKVYDSVVYKVLKDKEKLTKPIWLNNDPELKNILNEFISYSISIHNTNKGVNFLFSEKRLLKFIKKYCTENLDKYKKVSELPYFIVQFTLESLLKRFGYYKYHVSNYYHTSVSNVNVWVVETNFPFEYIYSELN